MTEYRGDNPLTKKELEVLAKGLEALEAQYDLPLLPVAEMFDYDDDYVDVIVRFEDGSDEEHLAVERDKLSEGLHCTELAGWIN